MRVVIIGGGIAGVEAAMTMAIGLPDAEVVLVHEWPSLRLTPNVVYVPFGVSAHRLDIELAENLEPFGVRCVLGAVEHIDLDAKSVLVDAETIAYDALILATGTSHQEVDARTFRTLDDALLLRTDLEAIEAAGTGSITITQLPDNTWPAPGYELAVLLGTWRDALQLEHVSISLVTSAITPFSLFGFKASEIVTNRLSELGVEIIGGVPPGRVESLATGVNIEMVGLFATHIPGGPPVGINGFYEVGADGSTAPDVYVVGDASNLPIKAAFATSWQARRVLKSLGGDLSLLDAEVDGIPVRAAEYQLDLGKNTLIARIPLRSDNWADLMTEEVSFAEGSPDKLVGTLIHERLLVNHPEMNAARSLHELLASPSHG